MKVARLPHPPDAAEQAAPPPARTSGDRRRLVLIVLAVVLFSAALALGLDGLIPLGLLLALSTGSDEEETRRSVVLTPRNVGPAAAMVAGFAWFRLWHLDLATSTLVLIDGALSA